MFRGVNGHRPFRPSLPCPVRNQASVLGAEAALGIEVTEQVGELRPGFDLLGVLAAVDRGFPCMDAFHGGHWVPTLCVERAARKLKGQSAESTTNVEVKE